MKKLFFTLFCFLLISINLNAISIYEKYPKNSKINTYLLKKFINNKNCDKILTNDNLFTNCYNYDLKSTIFSHTEIKGDLVSKGNIKKRGYFKSDKKLPKRYQTNYKDYTHTGFNRGHLITGNDASFDYSKKTRDMTYLMSNIVPMYPKTNQKSYLKVENYSRKLAIKFGSLEIINENIFTNKPKRLGRSKLAIPTQFNVILFNEKNKFQECFSIPNDNIIYPLKKLRVHCKKIFR